MKPTLPVICALLLSAAAAPALAHHSFAMFDFSKPQVIEGTVEELAWTNPHISLIIKRATIQGKPAEVWNFEASSPSNMTRLGWTKRAFNPGDKVRVKYYPLRNGHKGGAFAQGENLTLKQVFKGR